MENSTHFTMMPPSIESMIRLACEWEVRARKAGNVCPGREYPDLTVDDFLRSAAAIAPVLAHAAEMPLGLAIRQAIEATQSVVRTNTNLGIVLLIAPLATASSSELIDCQLSRVLDATTREDASQVYAAIRLANPGGLGRAASQDVIDEPTQTLREVMTLACERDLIAAQYADGFALVLGEMTPMFRALIGEVGTIEQAIVELQLTTMTRWPDSLIVRKLGGHTAEEVRKHAGAVLALGGTRSLAGRSAFREFDAWLRVDGHRRNPGTTADLIAATLYVALRTGVVNPSTAFEWDEHPFAT